LIEKVKKVSNPLTIVAIFAALVEVSGTGALVAVRNDLQQLVVWFIVLFPTLLIILFFLTLNFNPKVLYSPIDYKDESYFVELIKNTKLATADLAILEASIENSRAEMNEVLSKIKVENLSEKQDLLKKIDQSLKAIAGKVSMQRAKMESTFEDRFNLREMPNRVKCPKCEKMMGLTEQGDYECDCGHGITYGEPWWEQ